MQSEFITTFLGIKSEDIDDFITIRHRFDNSLHCRPTINKSELKIEEEKYLYLITEQENIEKDIEQLKSSNKIIEHSEKFIPFPYQSFFNLRHWRKSPQSLKIFFQALSCFFSISNQDFLTELKVNQQLIRTMDSYQPSTIVMNEFRMKYLNLKEISLEYLPKKSFDAYNIAIWIHNIVENEHLNRIKQSEIENELSQLYINRSNKQKEIQLIEQKIKALKKILFFN